MGKSKKEKKHKKEKKSKKAKKEKKEKKTEREATIPEISVGPSTSQAASFGTSMGAALEAVFGGSGSDGGSRDHRSKSRSEAAAAAEQEAATFKSRHINAASHAAAIEDMHRRFAAQEEQRTATPAPLGAPAPEERHVTEDDINEASAKLMRAEMAGEEGRLPRLRANLKNLRTAQERGLKIRIKRKGGPDANVGTGVTEATSHHLEGPSAPKRRYDGEPVSEQSSLMDLVRRERSTNARDSALEFTRMHMRAAMEDHFDNEMGENRGDEETKKKKKEKVGRGGEKTPNVVDKAPAVKTKCEWCIDNRKKHLVLSIGEYCYLTLPNHASMVAGHCYIVPHRHVSSGAHVDEDTWHEVMRFRKQLAKMTQEKWGENSELLVLETAWSLRPHRHAFFECIPIVDAEISGMATGYFKKEYSEAGPRWSKNKKLIEVPKESVNRAVPRGFPYLSAAFDLHHDTCFVHVIDDEKMYSDFFNREIIGSIMDVDPLLWRRPPQEKFNDEMQKVVDFEKMWRPFDLWDNENSD